MEWLLASIGAKGWRWRISGTAVCTVRLRFLIVHHASINQAVKRDRCTIRRLELISRRDTGHFCITDQYHSPRPTNGAHPHTLCLGQSVCIHNRHAVHHGLVAVFGAPHLWAGQRQQGQFAPLGAWVSELVVCDCLWTCTCISPASRNGITATRTRVAPVLGVPDDLLTSSGTPCSYGEYKLRSGCRLRHLACSLLQRRLRAQTQRQLEKVT